MVVGRLVHLHLSLVEKYLFLAHRDLEAVLIEGDRAAVCTVGRLDGTNPRDRVLGRLWRCVLGQPLPQTIMLQERFVSREVPGRPDGRDMPVLVYGDDTAAVVDGMTRAVQEIDTLALGPIVRLGVGLVGTLPPPEEFTSALDRECVLLSDADWVQPTQGLAERVLATAARSVALLWVDAETRAYGLGALPATAGRLADDFATGAVAELRRRRSIDGATTSEPVSWPPTQEPVLPLVSELVRCWWPAPGRARHIFGSPFDYMSTLEADHACG
jgi:hypothetical protein